MSSFRRGACVALFLIACNKKQDAAPPPPSGIPPLTGSSAPGTPPQDHPVHPPTTGADDDRALPPGHPQLPAPSGAFAGTTPGGQFDPKTVLAGVIKVDDKLKRKIAAGDTIFVVARRYEEGSTAPGTPLAVQKLTADKWPLPFALDSRDAMLAGTTLSGKVVVTVRVDKDGDAMTKNPGDVTGQSRPVEPPKKDVVVALDTVL